MAGVINKTARQYNLKTATKTGRIVSVRIAPGFNVVDDDHWLAFVSKAGKVLCPYLKNLQEQNLVSFGNSENDLELEKDPDTKAKSSSTAVPTPPKAKA